MKTNAHANTKTLGMIIAELRKKQGMTQLQLANQMGVTDKAVSKWERDLSFPDVGSLPQLAAILGTSVDELMQIKAAPEPVDMPEQPTKKRVGKITSLALRGVALAMGIAVVVLSVLGELDGKTGGIMLGLGLACIAVYALQEKK